MLHRLFIGVAAALSLASFGCAAPQASLRTGAPSASVQQGGDLSGGVASRDRAVLGARGLGFAGGDLSDSQDPIPILPSPSSPSDSTFSRWPGDGMGGRWGGGRNPVIRRQ